MPLLTRIRSLQVEIEAVQGTLIDSSPVDVGVFELITDPEDAFVQRQMSGAVLGNTAPGVLEGTFAGVASFKCELRGDGSQGFDAGLAILLQGCAQDKSLEVLTPKSLPASQKTLTMTFYENGNKKRLIGAMGTAKLAPEDGRLVWSFEFKGVWQAPVVGALPGPAYSTRKPFSWGSASNVFSLDSESLLISTFEFDLGNEVVAVMENGRVLYYIVSDRTSTLTCDPQTELVSGYDLYGKWRAGTEMPVSLAISDGTDKFTLAASKFQYTEVKQGEREKIQIDDITGQFNIVTIATGDDEYSMTMAAA
jgi:hypothetical protein